MKRQKVQQSRFMGAYFLCCRTYGRLYRRPDGLYRGRCPACGRGATRNSAGRETADHARGGQAGRR